MTAEVFEELGRRLQEEYPATGATAWENVQRWVAGDLPLVPHAALREFLDKASKHRESRDLIHESFYRNLPFGTGGVRGTVGFGPNRINPTVVALTIQAHCDYLNKFFAEGRGDDLERSVVIANDVRVYCDISHVLSDLKLEHNPYHADEGDPEYKVTSRSLAYLAARVYARNGYRVYMLRPGDDSAFLTTPELSFLIRYLHASGGINLSASHNPPDDNGVKVYDQKGGQYLPPDDEDLTKRTQEIQDAVHMPFAEAVSAGLVQDVPQDALDAYMKLYIDRARDRDLSAAKETRILFTPLSGCGERTVKVALDELGYVVHVPKREGPDGTFRSIPMRIANPEVPESTRNSKKVAESVGATLVLASDPDADRLGVEVYHRDEWVHLTGNQIGTILAYYLLLDPQGPRLHGGVYETVVTTLAVAEIARRAGCSPIVTDLLVGFKYIGHSVLEYQKEIEKKNERADDLQLLAFATEESHGYLDTPKLRDKDAMSGALYLAKLHERLADSGKTLVDYLQGVYKEVGEFGDIGRSVIILGSVGHRAIQEVMAELRRIPPERLGGVTVTEVIDRRDIVRFKKRLSDTDWEARNLLIYKFEHGQISFRPSGTEPKLKFYVQTRSAPAGSGAQEYAERVSKQVYQEFLQILSHVYQEQDLKAPRHPIALQDRFASLADVIPLEAKIELQQDVVPELQDYVLQANSSVKEIAEWFDKRISELVPGEFAWQVVEGALRATASDWDPDASEKLGRVFTYLREWQGDGDDRS